MTNKIKKLTGFDLMKIELDRNDKLWKVRELYPVRNIKEVNQTQRLLEENRSDFDAILNRYSFF